MRIIVLNDDFPPDTHGGAGIVALQVAQAMQDRGHEVLVVTTVRDESLAGEIPYERLRVLRIATSYPLRFIGYVSIWNLPVVQRLKKIISEFKPDVVHVHVVNAYLSYGALVVAKRAGTRVILTCHDTTAISTRKMMDTGTVPKLNLRQALRDNPFRNILIRTLINKNVDRVVAVSKAIKVAFEAHGVHTVAVIHNGIDTESWREPPDTVANFKTSHGLLNSVVLFGGRLTRVKGSHKLMEVISIVRNRAPDVQLLVVGRKDEYAERMLNYAREMGIAERVVFTDWLSGHELHQAFHAASVVVVPSLYLEPFGLVALEGMAAGKPVIATNLGGPKEIVVDGVTGYVVDPNNVAHMAEKIGELLQDKEKAANFGRQGRERAVKEFSIEKQIREYEKVYCTE
jgi:glycosyltransferase involved in cell wall biosynthesis